MAPVSVSAGKYAASAMPMRALAAAILRSAAATSGLRSRSVDGTPGGMSGMRALNSVRGRTNVDGGSPTSTATAFSSWARVARWSIACASVLRSCVSACTTSTRAATPAS